MGQQVGVNVWPKPGEAGSRSPVFCSSPTFVQMWKGQPSSGNCQVVLIWDLKIISRIQPSLPSPLFPVWYHLHPLPPEPHRRLLPGLLLPPRSPHSQRELMNPNQVRARWAQSFPGYASLLVKAKFSRWCRSPW